MDTQEKINRDLSERNDSEFQRSVLEMCRKYITSSATRMSSLHAGWDNNSYIYRGYRVPDREDRDAAKDGEPTKIIVPVTYAQIQTALSFILSTFAQRPSIFETYGVGPEDVRNSFAMNTDLAYQERHSKLMLKMYFWLLDSMKQGFGVVRNQWCEKYVKTRVQRQVQKFSLSGLLGSVFGNALPTTTEETVESILAYAGNEVENISPYAFYPDPSVHIARFQEGQFVAVEQEVSLSSLKAKEGDYFFGTDKIPETMGKDLFNSRPRRVKGPFEGKDGAPHDLLTGKGENSGQVISTEYEITLSEKQASDLFKFDLGDGTDQIKWLITIANDQKVIRFEPAAALHGEYDFSLIEFSPDHDAFFNPGLADTIQELQTLITFFLNSHVVNVRKLISNRFVGDPSKVDFDAIKNGALFIPLKGVIPDIDKVIKQLAVTDVTKNHVNDMQSLTSLVQLVTGVNENALGQYSSGRRSATEARNVNAGAAARMKMHAVLMWMQGIDPLGRQWLANTRQWRTREVYDQIVGSKAVDTPFEQVILADPSRLAGGYDFLSYDATLATDKQFQAGVLQELFTVLISNPNSMQLLNKNPLKLLEHIAELYGIRNLKDFDMQPLVDPTAQVVPDDQVNQALNEGTAEPVDMTGAGVLKELAGAA